MRNTSHSNQNTSREANCNPPVCRRLMYSSLFSQPWQKVNYTQITSYNREAAEEEEERMMGRYQAFLLPQAVSECA